MRTQGRKLSVISVHLLWMVGCLALGGSTSTGVSTITKGNFKGLARDIGIAKDYDTAGDVSLRNCSLPLSSSATFLN